MQSKVVSASVDWLTMTSPKDEVGFVWWERYVKYRRQATEEGDTEKPYNNGWYSGVRIGHMQWGYSEALGYILIASSDEANVLYNAIRPVKHKITRVDLAMDFKLASQLELGKRLYEQELTRRGDNPTIPNFTLFHNTRGGQTLYVGSRQSQQYGRLYDKGVQAGRAPKGFLWRAEVEYKKPLAGRILENLDQVKNTDAASTIAATVIDWFAARKVSLPVTIANSAPIVTQLEKRITTNSKKLAWLRTQVQPTVNRLIAAGLGREVYEALLLDVEHPILMGKDDNEMPKLR